jgi:hypothetical protein
MARVATLRAFGSASRCRPLRSWDVPRRFGTSLLACCCCRRALHARRGPASSPAQSAQHERGRQRWNRGRRGRFDRRSSVRVLLGSCCLALTPALRIRGARWRDEVIGRRQPVQQRTCNRDRDPVSNRWRCGSVGVGAPIRALGPGENLGPHTVSESLNIEVPPGIDGLAYSTYSKNRSTGISAAPAGGSATTG